MLSILHMTPSSLPAAALHNYPNTVKIMKKKTFSRAWNFLQNGIQIFVIRLIHSWEIALESQYFLKKKPLKKALELQRVKITLTSNINRRKKYKNPTTRIHPAGTRRLWTLYQCQNINDVVTTLFWRCVSAGQKNHSLVHIIRYTVKFKDKGYAS